MKKAVSGFLAALTLLSTVLSPVYASEVQPKEPKPPLYEEVKNQLGEILTQIRKIEIGFVLMLDELDYA